MLPGGEKKQSWAQEGQHWCPLYKTREVISGPKSILDLHGNIKTAGGHQSWILLRGLRIIPSKNDLWFSNAQSQLTYKAQERGRHTHSREEGSL